MARAAPTPRRRLILVRALVWAIIGAIYAPFYLGLHQIADTLGAGGLSPVPAAAAAGGIGAAFYGARQMALLAALAGVASAAFLSSGFGALITVWHVIVLAACAGLLTGLAVAPSTGPDGRCTSHLWRKTLTGALSGGACGLLLALAEPLHPGGFSPIGMVAFLVSVNGVVYVALVRPVVDWARVARPPSCRLRQGLALALVAVPVALGLWAAEASITGRPGDLFTTAVLEVADTYPPAMLAGLMAGALTGGLLELFRFDWVNRA